MEQSNNTPNLRSRVWNLIRTSRAVRGTAAVPCAALALALGCAAPDVLSAVMDDMMDTPDGREAPPLHCTGGDDGPVLVARYDGERVA